MERPSLDKFPNERACADVQIHILLVFIVSRLIIAAERHQILISNAQFPPTSLRSASLLSGGRN